MSQQKGRVKENVDLGSNCLVDSMRTRCGKLGTRGHVNVEENSRAKPQISFRGGKMIRELSKQTRPGYLMTLRLHLEQWGSKSVSLKWGEGGAIGREDDRGVDPRKQQGDRMSEPCELVQVWT